MKINHNPILMTACFVALTVGASMTNAQITRGVKANIHHNFTIGNTTLPAGQYTFRMLSGSDLTAMTVTSPDGNTSDEFLVREAKAASTPNHSQLVFDRYDGHEFLTKIFEQGSSIGVAIVEPSRAELRLQKQGQQPVEHQEEE